MQKFPVLKFYFGSDKQKSIISAYVLQKKYILLKLSFIPIFMLANIFDSVNTLGFTPYKKHLESI